MKRRDFFVLAGAAGLSAGISAILRWRGSRFEFEPLPGLAGFRRLTRGSVSALPSFLVGIDFPTSKERETRNRVRADPCTALFGGIETSDAVLPIAVFSDYYCPYCAILSARLIRLASERTDIRLILHELPLLHARSTELARIALAAGEQGAHLQAHRYLMSRRPPPGPAGIRRLATDLGLDPVKLSTSLNGRQIDQHLQNSAALRGLLGLPGTPGTVFGRTLVVGAIELRDIRKLIDLELSDRSTPCR